MPSVLCAWTTVTNLEIRSFELVIASSSACCPSVILSIINHQLIAPSSADISHLLLLS